MAALYVMRIKAGKMDLSQVPDRWQTKVKEMLIENP